MLTLSTFLAFLTQKNIMMAVAGICIAACIYAGVGYVHDKNVAEASVAHLQEVVKSKEEALRILTQAALQRNSAQAAADAARAQLAILQTSYDEIAAKVESANAEQDGPIAPVLRDVLNSLGGLQPKDTGQ